MTKTIRFHTFSTPLLHHSAGSDGNVSIVRTSYSFRAERTDPNHPTERTSVALGEDTPYTQGGASNNTHNDNNNNRGKIGSRQLAPMSVVYKFGQVSVLCVARRLFILLLTHIGQLLVELKYYIYIVKTLLRYTRRFSPLPQTQWETLGAPLR